jgi:hypothetical protein
VFAWASDNKPCRASIAHCAMLPLILDVTLPDPE